MLAQFVFSYICCERRKKKTLFTLVVHAMRHVEQLSNITVYSVKWSFAAICNIMKLNYPSLSTQEARTNVSTKFRAIWRNTPSVTCHWCWRVHLHTHRDWKGDNEATLTQMPNFISMPNASQFSTYASVPCIYRIRLGGASFVSLRPVLVPFYQFLQYVNAFWALVLFVCRGVYDRCRRSMCAVFCAVSMLAALLWRRNASPHRLTWHTPQCIWKHARFECCTRLLRPLDTARIFACHICVQWFCTVFY